MGTSECRSRTNNGLFVLIAPTRLLLPTLVVFGASDPLRLRLSIAPVIFDGVSIEDLVGHTCTCDDSAVIHSTAEGSHKGLSSTVE